jgi:hypothetical protein
MDEIVKQALAKWPHVPDCYGWLGLDARGNWYLRDDQAQAAGEFSSGILAAKGSQLRHEKLISFIQRNYQCDDRGCWAFQNGPQRVFVELEITPWIWRVNADFSVQTHNGDKGRVERCILDERGRLYLEAREGFGLLHTQDMVLAADAMESMGWPLEEMYARDLPSRYGYVCSPTKLMADSAADNKKPA